jgi:hypothetical protein
MRCGTWNAGYLKTVSRELAKCESDTVGMQEARWDKDFAEPENSYTFFYVNADYHLGTGFFLHKGIIISALKEDKIC